MITPNGLGAFHRRLADASPGSISKAVDLSLACGFREVYFMAEAVDGHKVSPQRLEAWGQKFRDAKIDPWVWSFPGIARAQGDQRAIVETMRIAWLATGAKGAIGDVEAPHKRRPDACKQLRDAMHEAFPPSVGIGFSSYGMLSFHPTLPIKELVSDRAFGMPQFYTVTPEQVARGAAQWRAEGFSELVYALPVFGGSQGENAKKLDAYLKALLPDSKGRAAFWSWPDVRRDMAPILRKHATCAP